MKKIVRIVPPKFKNKKGTLLINAMLATVLISFFISGCIKEDYPVRLVFPVLTTTPASGITATSATSGGDITSDGGSDITARGICWSNKMNPNLADTLLRFATSGTGIGQFSITVDTLTPGKTYHIRAFATSKEGTSYGQDISFPTPEPGK
jgi:hypothetical protein